MSTVSSATSPITARTLVYYRDLILVLVARDFKVRYKSTFMGYAWSIMHPLVQALIFCMVFRVVLRLRIEAYPLYLIAGLFPWQWISNAATTANFYFLGNGTLIKKVRFQRATLVLAGVLNESLHFIVSVPVILGFMWYYGKPPRADWLWIAPALVIVQLMMTVGVALVIATSNLFFRDLERLVALCMQMLFYLTPIVYALQDIPADLDWLLFVNPFATIVVCWQGVFYGTEFSAVYFGVALSWALAWLALGGLVYSKNVWRFAEIV